MSATKIEWADITINPVVGCTKCSPGCDNCYAERRAAILAKNPATKDHYSIVVDENGKWNGLIACIGNNQWFIDRMPKKKPKRIFIGSMTDMFHENGLGPISMGHIWSLIQCYPQHTFVMLTKRPRNMAHCIEVRMDAPVMPNLWLGVSVSNRDELHKLDTLRSIPAALRCVSFEPLLSDLGKVNLQDIGWVICGGETGPGARPMHPDWVRSLRDQCIAANVPFFFKGWGEWGLASKDTVRIYNSSWNNDTVSKMWGLSRCKPVLHGDKKYLMKRMGKTAAGRLLDGREWNEVPV